MSRLSRRSLLLLSARLVAAGALGALLPNAGTSTVARAAPVQPSASQPTTRASQDRIDGYVQERMAAWSIPGLSLAIVEDGQVTLTRGYGLADREQHRPMTPQTPVAIGSATKPITATAIMQLVEAGKVELDAPVTRYLP